MRKITAIRENNTDLYRIYGRTYHHREKLKRCGARWNPEGKYWLGDRQAVESVGADIMMRARVAAHCHESEQIISVSQREADRGYVRLGCGLCDTSYYCGDDVEILEVLGECVIREVNSE